MTQPKQTYTPKSLLQRFTREERGSAMTEFVITLPIFVMIFGGMGMLYKYSNEGLIARMNTKDWKSVV